MYCNKYFSSFVFRGCFGVNIADFLHRPLFPELYMQICVKVWEVLEHAKSKIALLYIFLMPISLMLYMKPNSEQL